MPSRATVVEQALCSRFNGSPALKSLLENPPEAIAVGVSGGPDSMALLYLLSGISHTGGKAITTHALTVDHGLRTASAKEARKVGDWIRGWSNVRHQTLTWTGLKPDTKIMEEAREIRYSLLHRYCRQHDIGQLWLAHHETDQAETFLFRLAKGSGLDGLTGMESISARNKTDLLLMRPLLDCPKAMIEEFCVNRGIPFVRDPTNRNMAYARSRLRKSLPVLEAEGLSEKRLATTAHRLGRARAALDFYTDKFFRKAVKVKEGVVSIDVAALGDVPLEIRIRLIRRALGEIGADGYGPRLESLEGRIEDMFDDFGRAKKFTLGNYLFTPSARKSLLTIGPEKGARHKK